MICRIGALSFVYVQSVQGARASCVKVKGPLDPCKLLQGYVVLRVGGTSVHLAKAFRSGQTTPSCQSQWRRTLIYLTRFCV
ncbi:hypothetical protein DER46DRAFT_585588 [Fusarium sp. MPI-SDFR-AT-0072]|nr:hypothetical protein DER46DRAFT_585588 [Fusarium sp. MPI-SDFR-AT-0072]